jgi:hypothetical protein
MKRLMIVAPFVLAATSAIALDTQQQVALAMYTEGSYNGCMTSIVQLAVQWEKIKDGDGIRQFHDFCLQISKAESNRSKFEPDNFKMLMANIEQIHQGSAAWLLTQLPKARTANKGK